MVKIAFFDSKNYDKESFNDHNKMYNYVYLVKIENHKFVKRLYACYYIDVNGRKK